MKQLYKVKTKGYKTYYVFANGYDAAKNKVEEKIIEKNTHTLLDKEGSLNLNFEIDEVIEITYLSNKLIS